MKFSSGYFYGNTLKNYSTVGLKLSETTYASALRLSPHSHEAAYFCYVLQGNFTETYGRRLSRSCRPSALIFHPADETHSDYFHTDARCFNIQMNNHWIERVREDADVINMPAEFYDRRLSLLAARLHREFREYDDFSPLVIEGLTLEMIAEVSRHSSRKAEFHPPRWLIQVRDLLKDEFRANLSLFELAESVGVHEAHLSREFRRFYRSTVGEYVRQLRIEFACRELSSSESSLVEIALAVGFTDQSHFGKTFKKIIGVSPAAYRKTTLCRGVS